MTQFSDDDIKAVAQALFARIGQSDYPYQTYAHDALTVLTELGWGKKPTRSELNDLLLSQYDQTAHSFSHSAVIRSIQQLLDAGFAVEDPEPEWEPTEEAVDEMLEVFSNKRNGSVVALAKHIRANPHLIGMGEGE